MRVLAWLALGACAESSAIDTSDPLIVDESDSVIVDDPATLRWRPRPGTSWQIQLSGTIDTSFDVDVYDVDLWDTPASTIAELHDAGRRVVCYFSAGSFEDWRPDADDFPVSAIGEPLDGWPGEAWLDTRSSGVRAIMKARLDRASARGCDGVDPDNVDGYTNETGFPLTAANQRGFNRFLAREAHARGLSIGLKNDVDQVAALVASFEWQINEQCHEYDECDTLAPFIDAGKPVFNIEYGGQARADEVCSDSNERDFDTLVKRLSLGPRRIACR